MKRIKMVLYAEPGVGKSVFACHAPKPFFICTDGNYEWLIDFGAKEEDHVNVSSWTEIKNLIAHPDKFEDYETIVLDLTEDSFKWCESEFCIRNKIDHISDLGYGKGYDSTRNEFFITISKLLSFDKNIILLMHGLSVVEKDRRGVEHTKHVPSSRIPDKVLDMIEGRVRYFLRAYVKDEEQSDGTVKKKRYLSLVPKPNEFGIIRGVDENTIPQDIPLDWNEFAKAIGYEEGITKTASVEEIRKSRRKKEVKTSENAVPVSLGEFVTISAPEESEKAPWVEPAMAIESPSTPILEPQTENLVSDEQKEPLKETSDEPKVNKNTMSNEEKLAAIKAKLAALKK